MFCIMTILLFLLIPTLGFFMFSSSESDFDTNELISQGRIQYQLLRERGNLPKYGQCWKSAIETVDEGCRELSEETQSDIALALTNCFLEMSGLETYHCDTDKKENVRRICISSMSDRAFNVYTEFYTHTLNMCWFLRGQIWQETISENTLRVGKQLEYSAVKQEKLLQIQQESLEIQDKMLNHGKVIEAILDDLSVTTQSHQEMIMLVGQTVSNLQSWLVGEVSWINTLVFYISAGIFVIILTSTPRTLSSRLPILIILIVNIALERLVCTLILSNSDIRRSAQDLYGTINDFVYCLRLFFVALSFSILIYKACMYEDVFLKGKYVLDNIYKQNEVILEKLENSRNSISLPDKAYLVYKSNVHSINGNSNCKEKLEDEKSNTSSCGDKTPKKNSYLSCVSQRVRLTPNLNSCKYNLRSYQGSPNGLT